MSDAHSGVPQEQMRLCTTCRMPVSILATRCRYCGATLGRPRQAEEKFTVEDLGGENRGEYTISGDLMDAMESFRMELTSEETLKDQPRSSRWFSRESKGGGERKSQFSDLELPSGNLDELASAEISYTTPPPRAISTATRKRQGVNKGWFVVGGGVAAAVVALALLWPTLSSMISPPPEQEVVYVNRALEILEAGRPAIEALEEARKALDQNLTEENKAIMAQVRERFVTEVMGVLSAGKYELEPLEKALTDSMRAADLDPDESLQRLADQVNKDVSFHRFLLTSIDTAGGTATFELNNPMHGEQKQTVKEGDLLMGRFKVERITSELVRLTDQEIDVPGGKRRLVSRLFKNVTAG